MKLLLLINVNVCDRHECLIMVSGGSGITPMISIIREIIFQSTKQNSKVPSLHLICAFKNSDDLTVLDLLLPSSGAFGDEVSRIELKIDAYVTREKEQPPMDAEKLTQTVRFEPNPLDSPICEALGPNSWLWLGAIISSSFVLFILFLGIVTRYYIYPIDHNTGEFYHFSFIALWDMLLVCSCIFLASSAVFLWCKRTNAIEGKQVQNLEISTSSPAQLSYGADIELESHPLQSLVQARNVHYGTRPDLKSKFYVCVIILYSVLLLISVYHW